MTKLEELQASLVLLQGVIQNALDKSDIETAKTKMQEARDVKDAIEIQKELDASLSEELHLKSKEQKPKKEQNAIQEFANAARAGFAKNSMTEGSNPDGGYTVPEAIETTIREYRETGVSMLHYVDRTTVSTLSGRQTYKKKSQRTGFSKVGEGGKIPKGTTPQFEVLQWSVDKYAGFFPITNELLEDSDANIASILTKEIGEESRVTANKLIFDAIQTKQQVLLSDLDDIKKAVNVTLGSAYKSTSAIHTNDDGLNWLDTLKDANGRYLLSPVPSDPQKLQIAIGSIVIQVVTIPNSELKTTEGKIPFFIGDLKEGITFFDRKGVTILASNTAAIGDFSAYEQDLTVFRAIERETVVVKDKDAFVNAYIEAM